MQFFNAPETISTEMKICKITETIENQKVAHHIEFALETVQVHGAVQSQHENFASGCVSIGATPFQHGNLHTKFLNHDSIILIF